jgi:hypothetical protein
LGLGLGLGLDALRATRLERDGGHGKVRKKVSA